MAKTERDETDTDGGQPRRKTRRFRQVSAAVVLCLLVAAGLAASWLATRDGPVETPRWLRARIEDRIERAVPGLDIAFAGISVVIEEGWTPRIRLRDVTLDMPDAPRLTLSNFAITVAARPLLEGQVLPREIFVAGAQLHIRRAQDGHLDLATPSGGGDAGQLDEALVKIKALLRDQPSLAALHRIDARALTIRYDDLRIGRGWSVDGGRVVATRNGDALRIRGDFALLGGRDYATTIATTYESRLNTERGNFSLSIDAVPAADLATQSPALAWLGVLDAPLSGALRLSFDDTGAMGPLNASLRIGKGTIRPENGRAVPFDSARSYFTFDPAVNMLRFSELSVQSQWVSAQANGELQLIEVEGGVPGEMVGSFHVTELTSNPGDIYPTPIRLDGAQLDLRLQLDPFRLSVGELSLHEDGEWLLLKGELAAAQNDWDLHLTGHIRDIEVDDLLAFWPLKVKEKTRGWIAKNVVEGQLHNVQLGLRSLPGQEPDLYLGFEFSDVTATFMRTLPPVRDARGHASLLRNRFALHAVEGVVDTPSGQEVGVAGTSFIVPDVTVQQGPAEVRLKTDSTIPAALEMLDQEPFLFLTKAGKGTDLAQGRALAEAVIGFPLRKGKIPMAEMSIAYTGTLTDVESDVLMPGRMLRAETLSLAGDQSSLAITGPGELGAVGFSGGWTAAFTPGEPSASRVEAEVEISDDFLREFNVGLPPGTMTGQGRGTLALTIRKGDAPEFTLTSDLAGVGLRLDAVGWRLSEAATGKLEVSGTLGKPPQIDRVVLDAPGLKASGRVEIGADGALAAARFSRVQIGGWFDAPVILEGQGKGAPPLTRVTGGRIDMQRASLGGGGGGKSSRLILSLDRLDISEGIRIDGFSGDLTTGAKMRGGFTGRLNGGPEIRGEFVPREEGASAIRIRAADAGGIFAAAGLLKRGREGDLQLTLIPEGTKGVYDGQLAVRGLWIEDAPTIAALLSSVSVVGLLEQLSGNGILFSEVDARFRLTPDRLILLQSSAVGASLGLSMDGIYSFGDKALDMQGVLSPVYLVNGIGSLLTRKGEGLIGFNFALQGPAAAPQVSVNPLSILTPGMFRDIFRRPPPTIN